MEEALPPLVHHAVEEAARARPGALAVEESGRSLTYGELDRIANGLAHRLAAAGAGPESRVALLAVPSCEMVAGALAILKAGGCYVPLDSNSPLERQRTIVQDSGAVLLLAQPALAAGLTELHLPWLPLDLDAQEPCDRPPAVVVSPRHLAYSIYTSGSTGRPKGVVVEHASLALLVRWHRERFAFGPADRMSQYAGPAFDVSVWETWGALANGASLHIPPFDTRASAPHMVRWLAERKITFGFLSTHIAELAMDEEWPAGMPLRYLSTAGDRLHRWPGGSSLPCPLLNIYGPTESTVYATIAELPPGSRGEGLPPIGLPLDTARIYILDSELRPLPSGEVGELWIAGPCLARGYHGRPDLTAERFVPDPFSPGPGERMYRTGDLSRFLPNGEVDFLGRADFQVKVRGFRIEPGEIEALLVAHPGVREALVLPREGGVAGTYLVAFLVPRGEPSPTDEVRAWLSAQLPSYMVPAAYQWLPAFPLNANGKIDRRALEAIEVAAEAATAYLAPRTPIEEVLAGLWSDVLGVERVGIHDPFTHLGGQSLLAVQLLSRIRRHFGVELTLRDLFDTATVHSLGQAVGRALEAASHSPLPPLGRVSRSEDLPLSFAQQGLWFIDRMQPATALYNVPQAFRIWGPIDPAALAAALTEIARRHEVLRSRYVEGPAGPVQRVDLPGPVTPAAVDLAALPPERRQAEQEAQLAAAAWAPFDLARGPLFGAARFVLGEGEEVLLLRQHHIATDGWSLNVLARELEQLYGAALGGGPSPLPELPIQYGDFAAWQRGWLQGEELAARRGAWAARLAGLPLQLELPADRPRPAHSTGEGGSVPASLDPQLSARLSALGRERGASLFMVLLAAFQALLARYSGQTDFALGSPSAGREREELEGLAGLFVNLLVLRLDASGDPTFAVLVERARESLLGAYALGFLPFDQLVEELAPRRTFGASPLVQATLAVEGEPAPPSLPGMRVEGVRLPVEMAKFDLSLTWIASPGGLRAEWEHSRDLFDTATVGRLASHLANLLAGAVAEPGAPLSRLPLLSPAEVEELLCAGPVKALDRIGAPFVQEWFARRAAAAPQAVAVVMGARRVTYGELAARSDALAAALCGLGVGPEVRVAVCAERSPERVAAVLAVLKAGGAYVSLDPESPADRMAFYLADSRARVLLVDRAVLERLPPTSPRVLLLDGDGLDGEDLSPKAPPTPPDPPLLDPENLAYVIYTSGSTGRPKGVEITHRGLANLVLWHLDAYGVTAADRGTLVAGTAFDASVWELWPLLAAGAEVHIPDGETRLSAKRLLRFWTERAITLSFLPTPLAEALIEEDLPPPAELRLRALLTGGDRLHRAPRPAIPFRLVNHYGPSEYSVVTTAGTVDAREPGGEPAAGPAKAPPIGRPIDNTRIDLLDARGEPVPPGVAGELYVAGVGLARGYSGRPDLTAERFLPDPRGEPGSRAYRTGDLVRLRPGGDLDFVGRADFQVKLRGFRVELGEIETALSRNPAVLETVVVVREDHPGDRRLAAYVVPAGGQSLEEGELRAFLARDLPDYMLPQDWVFLPALPLTPNGKVDRRALPAPDRAGSGTIAPRTPLEELLAGIFGQVLKREAVGVGDDFFALGGHSLLATQVVSRVRATTGVELEVRTLFEAPTVEGLARRVAAGRAADGPVLPPLLPLPRPGGVGRFPLSFAQARLWFLDRLRPGSSFYNIPFALRLEGRLDLAALDGALRAVVLRHEALRTRFESDGEEPVQVIDPPSGLAAGRLSVIDVSALPEPRRATERERLAYAEALRPFDLARGPLARFALLRHAPEDHLLLLTLHHVVADGWSMGVLLRELAEHYVAGRSEGTIDAVPPPVQYADFAVWQRGWLRGALLERETEFWRRRLAGAPAVLDLPADRPRPAEKSDRGATVRWQLPRGLPAALSAAARELGATPFILLLAAFQSYLARVSRQGDVTVGSPIAGRTQAEIEGLIGFFANTLVFRAHPDGKTFAFLVGEVREGALEAYAHQDLPFEKLVEALEPERSLSHSPLFQAMLVLVNDPLRLELPGLLATSMPQDQATSRFDLLLSLLDQGQGLEGELEYSSDLFDRTTALRLLRQLETLLVAALERPDSAVAALPLLASAEEAQVVREWNDTRADLSVLAEPERFRRQARRTPERAAVEMEGDSLAYAELDALSDRLAHRLRCLGAGPGLAVGICLERSLAVPVVLLGVLKAGGALLPLDPSYPPDRLAYMLRDAGAPILVAGAEWVSRFPDFRGALLEIAGGGTYDALEDLRRSLAAEPAGPAPHSQIDPEDLSYLVYTSGSTGQPKGVALSHRVLSNLVEYHLECEAAGAERTLQFTPLSFDVAMQEIFTTWARGGTLVLISDLERRDSSTLLHALERERIERLFLPFVALHLLAEEGERRGARPAALRSVITAGEQLQASEPLVRWFERLGGCTLENHYGPSETHVVTVHRLPPDPRTWSALPPIGRPIRNCAVYLLDPDGQPVPIGVPGEVYLGGVQTARGYLGRPEQTAARFLPDPFAAERGVPGARLYRTGDLARHRPGGDLEFLGRIDLQVKVRGFRVELGEVEAALAEHPGLRQVAVTAPEIGGLRRLVAYAVPASPAPDASELRAFLAARLPDYMVPSRFVILESLPMGATGKVDRRALPAPDLLRRDEGEDYEAPRTPVEALVAAAWRDLLGVERVGVRDNFFHLGGHSLLATRLLSRLRRLLGVELELRALFEAPTVEGLARRAAQRLAEGGGEAPPLRAREGGGNAPPLSFSQQRLWFLDQIQPGSALYNLPVAYRLTGPLEPAALAAALAALVLRHEVLRTTFGAAEGGLVQVIADAGAAPLPQVDLRALPDADGESEAARLVTAEVNRPFDLARGPLFRALLLRPAGEEWVLLLAMHHAVSDGWSLGVLAEELAALYGAALRCLPSPLAPLPLQYADYAVWQRQWLQGEELARQLAYWRERLAGADPVLELPTDRPRPAVRSNRGGTEGLALSAGASERLRAWSRDRETPLFMTTLAGFLAFLGRLTGSEDLVVGTPAAGRGREEIEGMLGFFVNTLVIRAAVTPGARFPQLLARVREAALGAYAHADLPFERLVEALAPERNLAVTPIFQVSFLLQADPPASLPLAGMRSAPIPLYLESAKFDLTLALQEGGPALEGEMEFDRDLFDAATVRRLARGFVTLLEGIAAHPEARIVDLPLLAPAERATLTVEWNDTTVAYPEDRAIQALFREQAQRAPEAVALLEGTRRMTYSELDRRSSAVARELRAAGAGDDRLVALCTERSAAMVVGMLAILKAGSAYAPIDPSYPSERLSYLLADTEAPVLLTQEHLLPRLADLPAGGAARTVLLGSLHAAPAPAGGPEMPAAEVEDGEGGGDRLAYVIYTSGSTGRPKGVAVPHRAVVRLVRGSDYVRFGPTTRTAQVANASFDAATFEVWGPLLNGGSIALVPQEVVLSPSALADTLRDQGVTSMFLTVALFNQMAREVPSAFATMREVLVGGEAVDPHWARTVLDAEPPRRLLNGYGPTENTTFSTWFDLAGLPPDAPSVPIGRPLANSTAYVLDAALRPVPIGVHGDLYVGGDGLARGYWRRPELTAERFVPDPLGGEGGRLYATGDRVRLLPSGAIEFLGRIDQQVKIRGFRIELGEIEAALLAQPEVSQAAVLALPAPGGGSRLVGYVVPATGSPEGLAEDGLREALRRGLPEYMIPSAFVPVASFPLTPNGKLDRRALAAVSFQAPEGREPAAPRTATEAALERIWAGLLGRDRVGIEEDFFRLGGHSLLATQAVSRAREQLGVPLGVRDLFEQPTVAALARLIDASLATARPPEVAAAAVGQGSAPALRPRAGVGELPLSFAQQRLWFLERMQPGTALYNVPLGFRIEGDVAPHLLAAALTEVVRRHESLRTRFAEGPEGPYQLVDPAFPFALPVIDLSALDPERAEVEAARLSRAEAERPFDLERGPLFRAVLAILPGRGRHLVLGLHHIVSDGWSLGVLLGEIEALYGAAGAGLPSPLAPLPVQYADFALWQRSWLQGGELERQLGYWREQLAGLPPLLELPLDHPRPPVQSFRGASEELALPPAAAEGLRSFSRDQGVPLFLAALAGFTALLQRYTRQEDLAVGTPIAGRSRVEIEGLVGFFVNTLVLRTKVAEEESFLRHLEQVRETALGAYAHAELPFERLVEELAPARSLSHTPLFQVSFALQSGLARGLRLGEAEGAFVELPLQAAKFDLTVTLIEEDADLRLAVEYARDLFEPVTARRLAEHLAILFAGAAAAPSTPLFDLPLLSAEEQAELLRAGWGRVAERGEGQPVHLRVMEQAHLRPEALAVALGERRLTYGELDRRSNRLARALSARGVGREVRVAVCAERTPERVAGLLAVLKAGGAFVSLDPSYPADRLAFLLADAGAAVLLTEASLRSGLPPAAAEILCLDRPDEWGSDDESVLPLPTVVPEDLAYVVYTSGSTGRPKGVEIPHRGLSHLVDWHLAAYGIGAGDRGTLVAGTAFDASVWELWPLLAAGAEVHIPDEETRLAAPRLLRFWSERAITTSFLPTPLAEALLDEEIRLEPPLQLRDLLTGGDRLHRAPRHGTPFRLVNHYGPSEYTVVTTAGVVPAAARSGAPVAAPPIGEPIDDTRIYLLDRHLRPVPAGVPGELVVAGSGLARGYLGRPDGTAERFVPDPFGAERGEPGARMYRTGDLVRRCPDGRLDFLGRVDFQVKIRGFRVELGEIETALARHPGLREAVVLVREDRPGDRRLAAYVTTERAEGTIDARGGDEESLRSFLARDLPDYMVPQDWVFLSSLPLTPNGKVDRRALPEPVRRSAGVVAPRTPLEELVAGIWIEVLGLESVGIHDSFWSLGGHSLLATKVLARVADALGVELPLQILFKGPTVAELTAAIGEAVLGHGDHEQNGEGDGPKGVVGAEGWEASPQLPRGSARLAPSLPLSYPQQRLWFLNRMDPGSPLYNLPLGFWLRGTVDAPALEGALTELRRRHESLRTRFAVMEGEPVQVVDPPSPLIVARIDLRALAGPRGEREAERAARELAVQGFDLERGPLLRAALIEAPAETGSAQEGNFLLVLALHHIVTDGWSMGIVIRELEALYGAALSGAPSPLPELPYQYGDYALWQREVQSGGRLEARVAHWRTVLSGAPPLLELPADRPRPAVSLHRGAWEQLALGPAETERLRELGRAQGASLFMATLAGFFALLQRYTGQTDLVVGTPIAGRNRLELEGIVGFFVNSVVLRAEASPDLPFASFLGRVAGVALDALAHDDLPFEKLVEALAPERSLSYSPLFQVSFSLAVESKAKPRLDAAELERLALSPEAAKFDLTVALEEGPGGLGGFLEYDRDLFDATTARRMAGHLARLLAGIATAPESRLIDLPLLSPAERSALLLEWSDTAQGRAGLPLTHELFGEQARLHPEAIALVHGERRLTYGELEARSNRLAHALRSLGAGPDVAVAVCAGRTLERAVALYAVLKAGGTLLSLDPSYPAERLQAMLRQSRAAVVLCESGSTGRLEAEGATTLFLDRDLETLAGEESAPPEVALDPDHLAFLVYTSGSTGEPKGIAIPHRGLLNMVHWHHRRYRTTAADRGTVTASPAFDPSLMEIFCFLSFGASLAILDDDTRLSPARTLRFWAEQGVTVAYLPTPLAEGILEGDLPADLDLKVRVLTLGGDRLRRPPRPETPFAVSNIYGPSEVCVNSTECLIPPGLPGGALLPPSIGRPLDETFVYILDREMQPVPAGVPGELYVTGRGLARGYLGRSDLTADRFVPDPWAGLRGEAGARIYRSGDRVRWLPDGTIDFLGRLDFQVKLRGMRIELGEIEAVLSRHPQVREALVLARPDRAGGLRLVAYVSPPGVEVEAKRWLAERLPEYMVPTAWVELDRLPMTANNKVDRRALEALEPAAGTGRGSAYAPPRTAFEELVAEIWADVLGLERVSIHDSFWDLGGHSLLATKVLARVADALGVDLPLQVLFKGPTVAELTAVIGEAVLDDGEDGGDEGAGDGSESTQG